MRIVDLDPADEPLIGAVAALLTAAFAAWPGLWNTRDGALEEVRESFGAKRLSLVALDADGAAQGWVGARGAYGGHTWELHPLAVRPDRQRGGVGRALVTALEERLRARGVGAIWLTTEDSTGRTALYGRDLYPDPLARLAELGDGGGHPVGFYRRLGYLVTGVIPDAVGPGAPDFLLTKRLLPFEPPQP